jgi:hypothetical protein
MTSGVTTKYPARTRRGSLRCPVSTSQRLRARHTAAKESSTSARKYFNDRIALNNRLESVSLSENSRSLHSAFIPSRNESSGRDDNP